MYGLTCLERFFTFGLEGNIILITRTAKFTANFKGNQAVGSERVSRGDGIDIRSVHCLKRFLMFRIDGEKTFITREQNSLEPKSYGRFISESCGPY